LTSQVAQLGIPYELVDAVEGRALTPAQRAELVDEAAVARSPHWLTPGTIGCTLSHRAAFQQILQGNDEVGLVVEDDVVVPPDAAMVLDEIAGQMRGREVVLLYYRSFEPCVFSSQDAVELSRWGQLLYPIDVRQPASGVAYLITREACDALVELLVPVRAAVDSWGLFHEAGAVERLRCVVPRPVGLRTDFKSTIDYLRTASLRARASTAISQRRIFPLHQLVALKRKRLERSMTRVRIVPERSPLAPRADTAGA
jgi:glycosyl transferase, family 25